MIFNHNQHLSIAAIAVHTQYNVIFALAIFFPMAKLAFQWQHSIWKAIVWEVYFIFVYTSCGSYHSSNTGSLSSHRSIISVLMATLSPTSVMHIRPAIWCSQNVDTHYHSQACKNFPKILHQHKKGRHQKSNVTQGPYCGPTNIRCHFTKFSYLGYVYPCSQLFFDFFMLMCRHQWEYLMPKQSTTKPIGHTQAYREYIIS